MKLSAGGLVSIGKQVSLLIAVCSLLFVLSSHPAHAQTRQESTFSSQRTTSPNTYAAPNTNPDVPQDQYTLVQSVTINVMASLICQIAGVDVINPDKGCLGIDPVTQKLGYEPKTLDQNGQPQVGGLLGLTTKTIGTMYTPPASSVSYVARTVENFGIVKPAVAQEVAENERTGFEALGAVQNLWEASRNLAYLILVVIFIMIGVGIMLRLKIDPRTSMTIQNQLPRIVVAILLITFSYGIVGLMIDVMWLGTYVGINALTDVNNQQLCDSDLSVREAAYTNILTYPLAFFNDIFKHPGFGLGGCQGGINYVSTSVGNAAGVIADSMMGTLLNSGNAQCVSRDGIGISVSVGACVDTVLSTLLGWVGRVFGTLVAFIALIVVLIRLWWTLLKAYAYIIIYTIVGPFWILFGLLPNSSLGFSGWMRTLTAKLLTFPAAAGMIIVARIIMDKYNSDLTAAQFNEGARITRDAADRFIPPLVGNPNLAEFGPLLGFAVLLITPELLNMLNDAFKAPANKYTGAAVSKGIGGGIAPLAAGTGALTSVAMRKGDGRAAVDPGFLRRFLRGDPNKEFVGGRATQRSKFANLRYNTIGRFMP